MSNEIYLYGTVGASFWDEEFFTATQVREQIAGLTGPLTVRLNSGGGVASEGQAIYTILRDYPGEVAIVVDGVAASAASLIAMAGNSITMRMGAFMMIHDPANEWVEGRGTEDDHLRAANGLRKISGAYAGIYAARAGITKDEARAIMRAETFFEGEEAVAAGFATEFEEVESAAAARFDYRVYAHSPTKLHVAGAFKAQASRSAIMAMMAGFTADNPKTESVMPDENLEDDQTEAELLEDEQTVAQGEEEDQAALDAGEDAESEEEDEDPSTTALAVQILDICTALDRPAEEARDMINRGLTLAQAVTEITAKRKKENPLNGNQRPSRTTARIVRDERSNRRATMHLAISAQITGAREVAAQVRPYMNMSLVEMAAECSGYTGSLRSPGDRQKVFMDSHSTSDFPAIFENALNKVLLERYEGVEPTYRQISRRRDFSDFREAPLVRAGDFPRLKEVNEAGEIKFGTFGDSRETAILKSYAVGVTITRQMMINDELGAIDQVLGDYGQSVLNFEEELFYKFFATAKLSDGLSVFHSSHKNLGTGADINSDSVSDGRAAMRKQKSKDGSKLNLSPSILLVGPDMETQAEKFCAEILANATLDVNPFAGKLTPVVTAEIENKNWYLLASADRMGGACFTYGYLDGASAPRLTTQEQFGTQGMSLKLEHDFGLGASDFRGGYKNPKAS